MRTNLRASQELFRLANLGSYVELQHRFLREYLETFVENSATLVRAIRRTADETLGPLEQQIEQTPVGSPGASAGCRISYKPLGPGRAHLRTSRPVRDFGPAFFLA